MNLDTYLQRVLHDVVKEVVRPAIDEGIVQAMEKVLNQVRSIGSKERLNIDEVSELTGYKKSTLYQMVNNKRIPYRKLPNSNKLLFITKEIEAWLDKSEVMNSCLN